MPLSWDNNRMWLGQPSQKKLYVYDDDMGQGRSPVASPSKGFRFVNGNSRRKRRRRVTRVTSPDEECRRASESPEEAGGTASLTHPSNSLLDEFGK